MELRTDRFFLMEIITAIVPFFKVIVPFFKVRMLFMPGITGSLTELITAGYISDIFRRAASFTGQSCKKSTPPISGVESASGR
jgi:hypothetical protein